MIRKRFSKRKRKTGREQKNIWREREKKVGDERKMERERQKRKQ